MSEQLTPEIPETPERRGKYLIRGDKSYFRLTSGRELEIKNVSPLLGNKLREKFPAPKPPKQKIATADGADFYYEVRQDDPDYLAAVREHEFLMEEKSRILLLNLGVAPLLTLTDAERRQVQAHRDFMKSELDIDLDGSDEFVFISYILLTSERDYSDLCAAIMNRSTPTEEAIANTIATMFPAAV
jgi:hypothetical protein